MHIGNDIPLIAVDVSKNRSHAQSFLGRGRPRGGVFSFAHDREGLGALALAIESLEKETGRRPLVALEATGIYSEPVVRFVRSLGDEPLVLSPYRTSSVGKALTKEGVKTDVRDCLTIAETAYLLEPPRPISPGLKENRRLVKRCRAVTADLRRAKCGLRKLLDEVFATAVSGLGDTVYNGGFLDLFARYPHPEDVAERTPLALARTMARGTAHRPEYYLAAARKFREACRSAFSGVDRNSSATLALAHMAAEVKELTARSKELHDRVIEAARETHPELFRKISEIPSMGGYIGAALICQCGDLIATMTARELVSFAGLAPRVSQSGARTGTGMGITRRGDSYLRSLLYLAVSIAVSRDAPGIADYYRRKVSGSDKGGAHPRRSALIATAGKLLRIIHAIAVADGGKYDPTRITGIIAR